MTRRDPSALVESMAMDLRDYEARGASDPAALAEVRDRLFDLLKVPDQLFGVHVEFVPGGAPQCRLSLEFTDAGRRLLAALGARDVDLAVVKEALGHFRFSSGSHPGEDAESPGRETVPAAKRADVQ